MPSLRGSRTKSFENAHIRDENGVIVPSRTSSLHSRIAQPLPTALSMRIGQRAPKTLTHAYMVCGVGREPSQWVRAPVPAQGKIAHMKGAVGQFWLPEILGSSPRLEQDNEIARSLHAAMRACFPHDVEICTGKSQPHCVHHSFVLQQDSSHTLYGIALRVWSRADDKRAETIRELRKRTEPDFYDTPDETYWIPYCLSFLSRYPLYNLLGDYLRGMWIHWNKATNLFHAEEVSRILSFPAPRLNDLVRIDMKDYALCYQFPSSPTGFQNFSMWPLFTCLSVPNIIGIMEAAVSPTRRIIFVTHYPAMLTVAAETVRYLVRVYEWSGLYVPVVHARHATDLVQEPGPYILGITAECRSLFTAPADALVVDLDRNFVLTSSPPDALKPQQRSKLITQLNSTLSGEVAISGVPQHLRSAYGGGKLIPAGQIIIMKGEVESIQDPDWWNQDAVMSVMDGVCEKLGRNSGIKKIFGGSAKKPLMTKVSTRHLNEVVRERNQYSRDAVEAWQDYINLKGRMDTELGKVTKRNNFLVEELESWRQQLLKFQSTVEDLTRKSQTLQSTIENHKRENRRLASLIEQQRTDTDRLNDRLVGTSKQRDDALQALAVEKETRAELERERQRNKKELASLQQNQAGIARQRDDAQRVVLHLHSLIEGQSHHMQHIVKDIRQPSSSQPRDTHDDSLLERVEESAAGLMNGFRETFGLATHPYNESSTASISPPPRSASRAAVAGPVDHTRPAHMHDEADRNLQEKTESIAYILRNISEQCAAAVDSLQLAQRSATPAPQDTSSPSSSAAAAAASRLQQQRSRRDVTQSEAGAAPSLVNFNDEETVRTDRLSTPPTPELEHEEAHRARNSSSMSVTTEGTYRDSNGGLMPDMPKMLGGRYDGPPQFGGAIGKGPLGGMMAPAVRGPEMV